MLDLPTENLAMVTDALREFPRPDLLAIDALRGFLAEHGISDSPLTIDVATLHYQVQTLPEEQPGYRENALITQRMNLVEAVLGNWQGETATGYGGFHYGNWAGTPPRGVVNLVTRLDTHNLLSNYSDFQVFNGLYRRTDPASYGPATRLAIRAEDLQSFIWQLHFHVRYVEQLDRFWKTRFDIYKRAIEINFIAACNRQVRHGSLGEQGRQMVWKAANLLPDNPGKPKCSLLNVYGYVSTSIVCLQDPGSPRTLLYIPGNQYPFHEFERMSALQSWFAEQCRDPDKCAALLQHFSPADWPDGLEFSGLRTALKGLGSWPEIYRLSSHRPGFTVAGRWQPDAIVHYHPDTYSPAIKGDLFEHLARWHQKRSYKDADSQIVSNRQVDKANWSNYLNVAIGMLLPIAMVVPALAPLLAVGGLAQFSLGLDQAINGRNAESQAQGVQQQLFGLLNALPLVAPIAEAGTGLFRCSRPGFFSSRRIAQNLGGRVGAAPVLEEIELQPAQAAFHETVAAASHATQPVILQIGNDLVHRFSAQLSLPEGLETDSVEYELLTDAFIRTSEARLPGATRWIPAKDHPPRLVRLEGTPLPTDAQRMMRLRSLGIHLQLPVDLDRYATLVRTSIPRRVSSIWTGDRTLSGEFLEALAHNAKALSQSDYTFELLLSTQDTDAYQANLSLLQARAPAIRVLRLEDQPFFRDFADSPYYAHYQAALGQRPGTTSNFSSACDILRYRLLAHSGGLYMDADDRLLLSTSNARTPTLERITLATTPDGLLLSPPVSNDQMGMYIKFNSSLIGSHPGNPTLERISEEILRRYQANPGFYRHRPDPDLQPAAFQAYARQLSQLTGPEVLNDVIDRELPWLRELRELCSLLAAPIHDLHQRLNLSKFRRIMRDHVPLDEVASIGSAHSWTRH